MNEAAAIETRSISRHFGKLKAVDAVDLLVEPGQVFGILGPNGAGKTTLIRMLATLLRPTSGEARVLGYDVVQQGQAVRRLISLTGQFASVDDDLTGLENLKLLSRLLGYSWRAGGRRAWELLEGFGLQDAAYRKVKKYSGGMRKRLDIAASLIVRPQLVFLDEPTTGLDPRSRNQVWDIVRALVDAGTTVLLTTQYLEEADQLARQLAVIDHGRLIARGTPASLKASVGASTLRLQVNGSAPMTDIIRLIESSAGLVAHPARQGQELSLMTQNTGQALEILSLLKDSGIEVNSFSLGQPSLDEVFFALTGRESPPHEQDDPGS